MGNQAGPAEVMVGAAVLHGIQNNGAAIAFSGGLTYLATFALERFEAEHQADKYSIKDSLGNTINQTAFDEKVEISLDLYPTGATRAAVAGIVTFPIILAAIVINNVKTAGVFGAAQSQQVFNGTYVYQGNARLTQQSGQACKLTGLKCWKWSDNTQNALMTAGFVVG